MKKLLALLLSLSILSAAAFTSNDAEARSKRGKNQVSRSKGKKKHSRTPSSAKHKKKKKHSKRRH